MSFNKKDLNVTHLPNGLRIWYIPNRKSKLLEIGFWTLGGVSMETSETLEYYHFLEHMLADFTSKKYPNGFENNKTLKTLGVDLQGEVQNNTMQVWMEGHARASSIMIDMLINTLTSFHMDPSRLEQERTSIITELNGYKNDPFLDLEEYRQKKLFPTHILSKSLDDCIDNAKKATIDSLMKFYNATVLTDRTVVYISGYLPNPEKNLKHIKNELIKIPNQFPLLTLETLERFVPNPLVKYGIHKISLDMAYTYRIDFIWLVNLNEFDKDFIYISAFEKILKTRLFNLLRIELGLIYNININSEYDIINKRLSQFIIEIEVSGKKNVKSTIDATLKFINDLDITKTDLLQFKREETNEYEHMKLDLGLDALWDDYVNQVLMNRKSIMSINQKHKKMQNIHLSKLKHVVKKYLPTKKTYIFVGLS
jgi:predicted Zn-dependent peptidase